MITLNDDQTKAYKSIINFLKSQNKIFLLYGSAGTGKTTLITEVIKNPSFSKKKIALCATTNKAVSVIQEIYNLSSKNVHFSTIHKLLQIKRTIQSDGSENYVINLEDSPSSKKKSIFYYDIIIIDESSMISKSLVKEIILLQKKIKGKIIFIGDKLQLPPINEDTSLVFMSDFESFKLNKVERSKNNIVEYSNAIRENIETKKKIKYKKILDENVCIIKSFYDWIDDYIKIFNNDPNSIILAYTNAQCLKINNNVRNKLFDNPKEKYLPKELIVFNNFYSNNVKKYYSSMHCVIDSISESFYKIDEFPTDCLFNLKYDLRKTSIDDVLKKKEKADNNDLLCPICFENDVEFGETTCGHSFCMDCIKLWLSNNKNCPYCRMRLIDNKILIKDNDEVSNLVNKIKEKINSMSYKTWDITPNGFDTPTDIVKVIHNDDSLRYKKDIEFISENLIKLKNILLKNKKDRLIKIILQRLWEFYYYKIIDKFADISYGYCITVHKSQGSTYNNVFVDFNNILSSNFQENQKVKCIYTAVTRASLNLRLFVK